MIFRSTSHIYLLLYVLFFLSCSPTVPEWIKSRSNDELFWHFVVYASLDASNNPSAKAKEHAILNTYVSNIKGGDFDSKYLVGIRSYDKMVEQLINQLDLASLFN